MSKNDWFGSTLVSDDVPLVDAGEGRDIVLREFRFVMTPNAFMPTKQILFNAHWPYMRDRIWADGLEPNEDHAPRVIIGKYAYRIFIVCQLKSSITGRQRHAKQRPQTLQEVFKDKVDRTKK